MASSMSFAKLYAGILESTIWCEPDPTRLVWITMLAMADQFGRVMGSVPGLANRARVPVEDTRTAIHSFLSPDPDSRTKDFEGRRVEEIDGGWRLLNHAKYRELRAEDDRREQNRQAQARQRAKKRGVSASAADSQQVIKSQQKSAESAHKDTDTEKREPGSIDPSSPAEPATATLPGLAIVPQRTAKLPTCPQQAIIDLFHEKLPLLPRVKLMPPAREKALRKLWAWVLSSTKSSGERRATTAQHALAWIGDYFARASENDFLMGRGDRSGAHANWRCDIDFLLTDKGMRHVIEKTEVAD